MIVSILLTLLHTCTAVHHIFKTSPETSQVKDAKRIYKVKWFNQTLDHFTFTTDIKFRQKYLVNDTFWDK